MRWFESVLGAEEVLVSRRANGVRVRGLDAEDLQGHGRCGSAFLSEWQCY